MLSSGSVSPIAFNRQRYVLSEKRYEVSGDDRVTGAYSDFDVIDQAFKLQERHPMAGHFSKIILYDILSLQFSSELSTSSAGM